MYYIPTITNWYVKYPIQLFSPACGKLNNFGLTFTIIDCYTFYLKKYLRDSKKAIDHYIWYNDFVADNQLDESLIFVYPDVSWMCNEKFKKYCEYYWQENIKINRILSTENFDDRKFVATHNIPDGKFEWIHLFGNQILPLKNKNGILTYDSMKKPVKFNEKIFDSIISSIQILL